MSVTEILVAIGGLALGYWVVTKLFDDLNRDEKPSGPGPGAPSAAPDAGASAPEQWHEVLKVSPQATVEEIRQSYQLLMRQHHPDTVGAPGEQSKALAEQKTKEIAAAYQQAMHARGEAPGP